MRIRCTAEVIMLDQTPKIKILDQYGHLVGYYNSVSELEKEVDTTTLTIKERKS